MKKFVARIPFCIALSVGSSTYLYTKDIYLDNVNNKNIYLNSLIPINEKVIPICKIGKQIKNVTESELAVKIFYGSMCTVVGVGYSSAICTTGLILLSGNGWVLLPIGLL